MRHFATVEANQSGPQVNTSNVKSATLGFALQHKDVGKTRQSLIMACRVVARSKPSARTCGPPSPRLRRNGVAVDSHERIISALRKVIRISLAIMVVAGVGFSPLASGAAASDSITPAEAESFVRSFYRDLEGDDFSKVIAHFDQKVVYYGVARDRDYVASDLGKYCASYSSRSFTVGEIQLKPNSGGVTVKFDVRFFIRSPERDITRYGRTHVDWDLARRDGALKISRFDGSAAAEPKASPSS